MSEENKNDERKNITSQNEKPKKKLNKWLKLGIVGVIALAIISGAVFAYHYFTTTFTNTTQSKYSELTSFEDGSYYLLRAKKNITFDIISDEGATDKLFKITDEDGNEIENIVESKDGYFVIKPPKDNYIEGNTYTLVLTNSSFKDEELKETKTLVFKIERKSVAEYSYKDNVKELSKSDVELTDTNDVTTIKVPNNSFNENDVLLLNDNGNFEAYKITKIENDILTVTAPELADIYEKLNLYKDYNVDYSSIVIDKDIEEQVEIAFRQSAIYQFFVNESKAASPDTKIKIKPSKSGISMDISITLLPDGESNLGIKALANHKVTITFKYNFSCKPTLDIDFPKKIDITTKFSQDLDFDINIVPDEKILKGIKDLTEEEYNKAVSDVTELLYNAKFDTTNGSQKIVTIPLETSIPGVTFDIDLFTISNFNLAIETTFNHKANSNLTVGLLINKNGCKAYKTVFSKAKETEFTITGKADFEFGIKLDTSFVVFDRKVAYAGIITEAGVYGDMYITFPLIHKNKDEGLIKTDYVGSLEIGKFCRCRYEAKANLIIKKIDEKKELLNDKEPVLKFKNDTLITGIKSDKKSVNIENGKISIPKIKLLEKNILTNKISKTNIDVSKLTFKNSEGKELTVKDNKIEVPEKDDTITVVYEQDDKKYETTFKITIFKFDLKEEYRYANDMAINLAVNFHADNNIVYSNNFAACYYIGKYKVEGNKVIGTLTEVIYLDHEKSAQQNQNATTGQFKEVYTTKKTNGTIILELLNNGNIKLISIKSDIGLVNGSENYILKPTSNKKAGTTKLKTVSTNTNQNTTTSSKIKLGEYKLTNEAKNYTSEAWYLLSSSAVNIEFKQDKTFILHGGDTVYYYGTYSINGSTLTCNVKQEENEKITDFSDKIVFSILNDNKIKLIEDGSKDMNFYAIKTDIFKFS